MGGIEAFVLCVRYLGGAHQEGTADRNRVDRCFVKVLSYSVAGMCTSSMPSVFFSWA